MARRIDKKTEETLVEALEKVCQLASTPDVDPNEAMATVVREYKIRPGHIQLMVQAYNNGRTNSHLKSAEDIDDRASSFPLANVQAVIELVYPNQVVKKADQFRQEAFSSDYLRPPDPWAEDLVRRERIKRCLRPIVVKSASAPTSNPLKKDRLVVEALSEMRRAETEGESKRLSVFAAREKLAQSLRDLDNYFRRVDALPISVVMAQVRAYCGRDGERILQKVAQALPKRQEKAATSTPPVNWSREPYSTVLQCVRHLHDYVDASEDYETFCRRVFPKVAELHSNLTGMTVSGNGSVLDGIVSWREKISCAPPTVPSTREILRWRYSISSPPEPKTAAEKKKAAEKKTAVDNEADSDPNDEFSLKKLLKSTTAIPPQYAAVSSLNKKLDDPKYFSESSEAWIRFLLYDMLATDPVLSGFSPDELTAAYNEIALLAPRAVNQPALLRQLLRRYLSQGALDVHDLNQLVQIERKLQQISSTSGTNQED